MIFKLRKVLYKIDKWVVVCVTNGECFTITPQVSWAEANAIQSRLEVS